MGSMAQMTCAGNLARDVEMKHVGEHPVVDIIVMVNQRLYKGKNPDGTSKYEEDTMTVSTSFWRERAGSIAGLQLRKGTFVILSGNPRLRTYPKGDGTPGAEIILENADLTLGPKVDPSGSNGAAGYAGGGYTRPQQSVTPPVRSAPPAGAPVAGRPAPKAAPAPPADEDVPFPEDAPPEKAGVAESDW